MHEQDTTKQVRIFGELVRNNNTQPVVSADGVRDYTNIDPTTNTPKTQEQINAELYEAAEQAAQSGKVKIYTTKNQTSKNLVDESTFRIEAGTGLSIDRVKEVSGGFSSPESTPTERPNTIQIDVDFNEVASKSYVDGQLSGKANKSEMSITPGTGDNADKTTITLKEGTSATVLTQHQDISGKVDVMPGKGLSTNDYTDADKQAVATIGNKANTSDVYNKTEVDNKVDEAMAGAAFLGDEEGEAYAADFNPRTDTLWKKEQLLSSSEKAQVIRNLGISDELSDMQDAINEQDKKIALLDGHDLVVVDTLPTFESPAVAPDTDKIYRLVITDGNDVSYEDYMYTEATTNAIPKKIATYAIPGVDNEPTAGSNNLVRSGSLYSLAEEAVGYSDFEDIKGRLSVAQDNKILVNGVVTAQNNGFITTPLQVYKGDTVKITAAYYPQCDAVAIDNGNGTYTTVVVGYIRTGTATYEWTAPKDCVVVFSGIFWNSEYGVAEIFLRRASKVENKINNLVWKKRIIDFNINLTPGLPILTSITLGQKFPFGGAVYNTDILRGIFEVTEGERVYFSGLPLINNNFSGCAILDKNYIVISLKTYSEEIYFEVPAGGKYVVFQALTASGYPTVYVESLEDTTEEIDTAKLELLQDPTIDCLDHGKAYIFGDVGTKVTESDAWQNTSTRCYSCVPGDIFYITGMFGRNLATCTFAVVSETDVILAKDIKPAGFWHYMTKVVVPEGGAKFLVNNDLGDLRVYKKKVTRDIYPEKESLVAATSLVTVGADYSERRLRLSWVSDTHADNNRYKRWIDWTNSHIGMFDAALHTGDFNRMADADNSFIATAVKYRTTLPFLPTLGNHDCFGYTVSTNTLNSGSLEWNGNKYIKPFVENDSACVVSNDGCYYYRDFTDKKIRMIVINDYDKPRWADGTCWITTTDEAEIASAVEWTSGTSYAVGDVVHYKGMYVKCKTEGILDDNAHVWRPDRAVFSKTITDCRYINQAQADFIVSAMNVSSGWGIIFVTHQPYEALPASEHCISKWTLRRDLVSTYVGVKFGQNGYIIQDLITAYLNKTTLNKTYECITPNVDPLANNVVKTNLPDFYPDVTINVDFTNAAGDIICCLNGHQHADTAYWSQHTGEKKVLCIGAPTDCYLPFNSWSNPWPAGDIAKNGGTKDCFNAISIDTTEKAVYLVRIGADRTDQFETRDYIRISYAHNQ